MDLTAKVEKLQEILERLEAKVDYIIEERKEQTSRELQNTKKMHTVAGYLVNFNPWSLGQVTY